TFVPVGRAARAAFAVAAFALACAGATLAFAQPSPPVSQPISPPVTPPIWRPPVLQVQGAEQPIRLASLQLDVEVSGGAAQTRVQMVFFNPNPRILEGKLQFPLAPGQVVSGFALDVDGKLRAAVPVEKARAQQVFEDIARRRVDPGLLETTVGNNYELRIYPLLPGRTRTVELRIVEPASSRLQVPLAYGDRVENVAVALRVPGATSAPELIAPPALGLRFERAPGGGYAAQATLANATLPKEPIALRVPTGTGAAVAVEPRGGDVYFTLELPVPCQTATRPLPRSVQIVWDASGSGARRRMASAATLARGDGLRRREQPRRGSPRRRLAGGALVQRRPRELRRAVAARVPGAGLCHQQRREQRPRGAAGARRRERRPQHRPADGDAPGRGRRAAQARQRARRHRRGRRARRRRRVAERRRWTPRRRRHPHRRCRRG